MSERKDYVTVSQLAAIENQVGQLRDMIDTLILFIDQLVSTLKKGEKNE